MTLPIREVGYTPPGTMPPFVNIKRLGDSIRITVRAQMGWDDQGFNKHGETGWIDIPIEAARDLFVDGLTITR